MKKVYFIILFLSFACFTSQKMEAQAYAQNTASPSKIEGLTIYPNPVNAAKPYINISSKRSLIKNVEVFDVLGKKVFATVLAGKELNVSNLQKGVYILKISENNVSESRKLVIR
ncbi:MAG: T9SS type A sorting domain-containing protein [Algibacter sp.]|uniref:T9SS type A sorting domain-containing protein n=1 Tax=Algibacter sp. TaxID=1872428 RepID=UPI0032969058